MPDNKNTVSQNNKRIAKNTLMLYMRMLLTMVVSLYTSRIILNTLGVEDFGIYNVVGGFVSMFGFLNSAMASATQRFLAFEIGKNDKKQLRNVFCMSVNIHFLIAFLILILAETGGLWFVNTQLTIPAERMAAARWVYQFSIFTLMVNMISVPYNAIIIAHERMNVFAWVSIFEVSLKLLIVFMLVWFGFDKLKFYAVLIFGVALIIRLIYGVYCKRKFKENKYKLYWNKTLFKTLTSFAGWNLWGTAAWIFMGQGLNVILNISFGPTVNAARGIAYQINAAVSSLANNFRMAINPSIVKSVSSGNIKDLEKLSFASSKYSFFLLLILATPILLETNIILKLWLKIVPDHTSMFVKLIIINTLIQSIDLGIVFTAIGKIKQNQFFGGIIYLLTLPLSFMLFKLGLPPEAAFYSQIISTLFVVGVLNIYLLIKITNIPVINYIKEVIIPVIKVSIASSIIPILIHCLFPENIMRLLILSFSSTVIILLFVYIIGIDSDTRRIINKMFTNYLNRANNGRQ